MCSKCEEHFVKELSLFENKNFRFISQHFSSVTSRADDVLTGSSSMQSGRSFPLFRFLTGNVPLSSNKLRNAKYRLNLADARQILSFFYSHFFLSSNHWTIIIIMMRRCLSHQKKYEEMKKNSCLIFNQ